MTGEERRQWEEIARRRAQERIGRWLACHPRTAFVLRWARRVWLVVAYAAICWCGVMAVRHMIVNWL